MASWKDVVAIARTLPGAEVAPWYGTTALKVNGKGFARLRTEAEGGLVLMCSLEEKEQLLESGEPAYFTTPHYDGWPSVLIRFEQVDAGEFRALLTASWREAAPKKVVAAFDALARPGQATD